MEEENKLLISGEIEGWKKSQKPRQPKEASEGIDTTRSTDSPAFPRAEYLGTPPGAVSLTKITVADLLSEGLIDGLVTGYHTYVGTAGNTGWTSAAITNYPVAPNTSVRFLPSIYWNQVPVVNPSNQFNFQSVTVNFTPGLPNGSTTAQISTESSVVRSVGERLRYGSDFAKLYRILNKNIKAVDVNVRFNQLSRSVTEGNSAGDLVESEVKYNISYRPLYSQGSLSTVGFTTPTEGQEKVRGKISFGYIRKTRINLATANQNFTLEPDFLGWEIKVERMTPDSTTSAVRDQTFLDSILEIYGDVFSYPNSAMVHSQFSAEYFSQVPVRHYEVKGLKVQIPSNYSPLTKTYSPNIGNDWDGTFKTNSDGTIAKEWTDNPAWCYFDLLTNRNYGLGKYITGNDISVDKWTLYDIGRYCDVLVSNGEGGLEPRFSCNVVLNSREEAYKVVNDMASIFRGMAYYGAGTVYTVQDSPKNPYLLFTNANVENGDFAYSSSSRRVRHTVAIVRYNDKKNYYKPAIEYVEDVDGIRRYGIREIELIGFGCTSRGQAVRLGRWALLSETTETETINFTAGLDGAIVRPGDVIQISDRNKRGTRYGGRTYQIVNPSTITLDSEIPGLVSTNLYNFHIVTPTWNYDPILTSSLLASDISGIRKPHIQTQTFRGNQASSLLGSDDINRTQITFSDPFNYIDPITNIGNYSLSGQLIWMVDSSGTSDVAYNIIDNYRIVNINEKEPHKYTIAGVQYNINKYNQIESGLNFGTQSILDTVPPGPSNLVLDLQPLGYTAQNKPINSKKIHYTFALPNTVSAESAAVISKYLVYVKQGTNLSDSDVAGNTYLINILPPNKTEGDYIPFVSDTYFFRVYSATANNTKSTTYASNEKLVTDLNPISDIIIQSLQLDSESQVLETTTTPTSSSNDPGSRQVGTYTTSDPTYIWQVGFQSNALININLTGLGYRVTIRKPSDTNAPDNFIYFGPNNLPVQLTGKFANLSYTFPFSENKGLPGGPYRNYDIVVEAVNTHDKTSAAGGKYENPVGTPTDTIFTNPFSYDIFGATNPPINDFELTDPTRKITSPYNTEQWINTDGTIKLWVKQNIPPDWEGGAAYVWTGLDPFTQNEAFAKFVTPNEPSYGTTDKNIIRIPFEGSGENGLITIPTGITGYMSAYMSVSPMDSFDLARYQNGILRDDQLKMSSVVKIQKRLGFNEKLLYKAWAETEINYHNRQIATDWTNYTVGIQSIVCESYNDVLDNNAIKFKWNFNFDTPLPNTNYVVVATNTGAHILNEAQIIKYKDKVQFYRFNGKQFFGVLYNGNDASVV